MLIEIIFLNRNINIFSFLTSYFFWFAYGYIPGNPDPLLEAGLGLYLISAMGIRAGMVKDPPIEDRVWNRVP